jgi:hypothetical protein
MGAGLLEKESRSVYGSRTPSGKDAFAISINLRRLSRHAGVTSSAPSVRVINPGLWGAPRPLRIAWGEGTLLNIGT